jgi:hypothetical protein
LDTGGNVFGGFTPLQWESESKFKCDDSLKSFVFTLKNPHNIPARKFALKAEEKQWAIYCNSSYGLSFCGIYVSNNCNANNSNTCRLAFQPESTEVKEHKEEITSNKSHVVSSDRDEGHDMSEKNG